MYRMKDARSVERYMSSRWLLCKSARVENRWMRDIPPKGYYVNIDIHWDQANFRDWENTVNPWRKQPRLQSRGRPITSDIGILGWFLLHLGVHGVSQWKNCWAMVPKGKTGQNEIILWESPGKLVIARNQNPTSTKRMVFDPIWLALGREITHIPVYSRISVRMWRT